MGATLYVNPIGALFFPNHRQPHVGVISHLGSLPTIFQIQNPMGRQPQGVISCLLEPSTAWVLHRPSTPSLYGEPLIAVNPMGRKPHGVLFYRTMLAQSALMRPSVRL